LKKTVFFISLLFLFLILPFPSVFGDSWVSPVSAFDENLDWTNEANSCDENTGTFAKTSWKMNQWTGWLDPTLNPSDKIDCNLVRLWALGGSGWQVELQYYGADYAWHQFYVGVYNSGAWTNVSIGETVTIWRVRVRFYVSGFDEAEFNEFYFWEVEGVTQYKLNVNSLPFQNVNFTLNGTTYQTNYTNILDEGYYNVTFPSSWVNNSITYVFKNWSDGNTNPSRIINLNANTTLTVTYVLPPKIHILFVGACVISFLIMFIFILAWKRKKR